MEIQANSALGHSFSLWPADSYAASLCESSLSLHTVGGRKTPDWLWVHHRDNTNRPRIISSSVTMGHWLSPVQLNCTCYQCESCQALKSGLSEHYNASLLQCDCVLKKTQTFTPQIGFDVICFAQSLQNCLMQRKDMSLSSLVKSKWIAVPKPCFWVEIQIHRVALDVWARTGNSCRIERFNHFEKPKRTCPKAQVVYKIQVS